MEEISCVAGLYLTNDVSSNNLQFIGTVSIPKDAKCSDELRKIVLPSLQHVKNDDFVFVTEKGLEVSPEMEKIVTIATVLCPGNVIKLRLKDANRRIGLAVVSSGSPGETTAEGFVILPPTYLLSNKISDIRLHIDQQLPSLYKRLTDQNFQFLDSNGWPMTKDQEDSISTIQALTNNTIRIKLWPQTSDIQLGATTPPHSSSPIIPEVPKIETPAVMSGGSSPVPGLMSSPPSSARISSLPRLSIGSKPFEIMISYVHKETTKFANLLCDELQRLNYMVFLDTQYIKPGVDWQDVLNEAVFTCSIFVPLISNQYGLTEWTNKEVKLADTLDKSIVPVNFLPTWPPMCLAIQFATTQYIRWGKNAANMDPRTIASKTAAEISERYQVVKELKKVQEVEEDKHELSDEAAVNKAEEGNEKLTARSKNGSRSSKKFSTAVRKSLLKKDSISSLAVLSHHAKQVEMIEGIQAHLEGRGYEVWACSAGTDPQKRQQFKTKVNEAGVVIFLLSQDFAEAEWCEQEVYYCEGRKRIIPVVTETFEMPCWMSTLIGNETFLDSRSNTFQDALTEEVECATQPSKAEGRLRKLVEQKTRLHKMCKQLTSNLPSTGKFVYISGGTRFFSQNGEAICREIGKQLAHDRNIVLVTGGFFGVGETVGRSFYEERTNLGWDKGVMHIQALRDDQDRSMQTRQNADGTFKPVPYGKTIFMGSSVRQREMITAKCLDLCILIEGGPGAAFEAHQFSWNDHTVIPIQVTGGAAAGKFNVPHTIFIKPVNIPETEWETLQDEKATPLNIAKAVANIAAIAK